MSQYEEVVAHSEGSWMSNAPWWLISAGVHVVVILTATLIAIERMVAADEGEVMISMTSPTTPKLAELEKPRDVFEHKGLPSGETAAAPTEYPRLFMPDAEDGDHPESNDNEPYHQMKGDSKDFLSYIPGEAGGPRGRQAGKNQGVYDTLGVGGGSGGGGRYGGRYGGDKWVNPPGGGTHPTKETETAVMAALKWLARHQNDDGSWSSDSFSTRCCGARCGGAGRPGADAGLTGLALLAFLGSGYTHLSRDEFPDPACPGRTLRFGDVVKNAIRWLTSHQDRDGLLGGRSSEYMYHHAIGALALSEAFGMTQTAILKDPAQKAIDFIVTAQNPGQGWRYRAYNDPDSTHENDSSVTGWCVMALKSAETSDLSFPKTCYEGALNWFKSVTDDGGYYRVGYNAKGTGKVYDAHNQAWEDHPSMSAVAILCRIFIQKNRREPALGAANLLLSDLPEWKTSPKKIDFYYWYYGSLALFQYDGPDGAMWKRWNEPMKNALVPTQRTAKDGCANGSWDTEVDRWSCEGGRVYATAINALTLEVYYRYGNVFGAKK